MPGGIESLDQLNADTQANYGDGGDGLITSSQQQRNAGDTKAAILNGGRGQTTGYKKPLMISSSPADIATVTPQSTHIHSGRQLTLSTGEDTSLASGRSLLVSVAQSISLFAQAAGAKLFAAKGKIEIQAQSESIELTAMESVRITSTARTVEIAAQEEILLTSGAAYIRIKGGNIEIHAPGTIDIKGVKKTFSGPAQLNRDNPAWPKDSITQSITAFAGQSSAANYQAWAGMPYTLLADGAEVKKGVMDATGQIAIEHHATTTPLSYRAG